MALIFAAEFQTRSSARLHPQTMWAKENIRQHPESYEGQDGRELHALGDSAYD